MPKGNFFVVLDLTPETRTQNCSSKKFFEKHINPRRYVPQESMPFIYNIADLTLLPPPLLSVPGMYGYFVVTLPKKSIEYAACGNQFYA